MTDPGAVAAVLPEARDKTLDQLRDIAEGAKQRNELIRLAHVLGIPNSEIQEATGLDKVTIYRILKG